jgi:predicted nucleic acid-binding protein
MQKERRKDIETVKPKVYVDTNILRGAISGRTTEDIVFINKAKEKNWEVYTSIYTLMELLDIAKDRKFLIKSVIDKWIDVATFLQGRKAKNLSKDDLLELASILNNFFLGNKIIKFINIKETDWELVKKIGESSNLHSSDVLHLVTAWVGNCHVLVTHDDEFIKEGNRILQEENVYNNLRICNVDKVEATLSEIIPSSENL